MRQPITRRKTLSVAGATGALALAGCVGGDDADDTNGGTTDESDETIIRVGTLQDITGENGPEYAHQGLTGFLSGLAYKNDGDSPHSLPNADGLTARIGDTLEYTVEDVGDLGEVTFEVLIRDTASESRPAGDAADDLVHNEGVDVLYGLSSSDGLERVNNIVLEDTDIPLFVGQASTTNVTADGDRCRSQLFRASANTAMNSRAGALYMADNAAEIADGAGTAGDPLKVAMINVPTSFGQDMIENYNRIFEEQDNVEVVFEREVEERLADEDEWIEVLDEAEDENDADALVYGFTGATGTFFAEAFVEGGYDMEAVGQGGSRMAFREIGGAIEDFIGGAGIDELTQDLVDRIPFGPFTCRYFWHHHDKDDDDEENEINDWFIENHTETYGVLPDLFTSAAFTSASAIVQAFEQANEASLDAIMQEVPGMTVEATPKGEGQYHFQEYNNQARSPVTIARYAPTEEENEDVWPAALQPSDPIDTIDMDETTLEEDHSAMTCDLR